MFPIDPAGRHLVVTGVGYRDSRRQQAEVGLSVFSSDRIKPNIGAAVALKAAEAGYSLTLVSRTHSKLEAVRLSILERLPDASISVFETDLLDPASQRRLVDALPVEQEVDVVHSAGLSASAYTLPGDNPYLDIDKTPVELPLLEFEAVARSLLITVQAFLPRWRTQHIARLVVVSSMSGIRAVPFGFSHSSAKAALHHAVRSLCLELNPLGVRVSEVLPGIVNTGMYDSESVDYAIRKIGKSFGYSYEAGNLPQMSPIDVAETVVLCLRSNAHILSVAMVAEGQFPNHGA